MPSFIALGCLEVGEKFMWGGWCLGGGISILTTELHQPEVGLGWAVIKIMILIVDTPKSSFHFSWVQNI